MSLSTTCKLFWTDLNDNVVSTTNETAQCDSTYTQCLITPRSSYGRLHATCDSKSHFPEDQDHFRLSSRYSQYFCTCNGRTVTVPSGVTCGSTCYHMDTRFPDCALVTLYDGIAQGSPDHTYKESCTSFDCDTTGVNCTNADGGGLLYKCDNYEHDSQIASESSHSYVCNCHDPATIPSIYTTTSKDVRGKSCGTRGGGGETTTTSGAIKLDSTPAASPNPSTAAAKSQARSKPSSSPLSFGIVTVVILLTRRWRRS
ncbi:hypothetical protein PG996_013573 [Apiospora saccharicola]|uniref:Uncharacterized protein n=1 Tax=Apiospora saccharicola TaxID=335842 RepID=A0ABR1U5V8_9PEZI